MQHNSSRIVNTLLKIFLISIGILFLVNLGLGDDGPREPPAAPWRSSGDQLRLPAPMSAASAFMFEGDPYLAVMTKPDNERIQAADLRIISLDPQSDIAQIGRRHTSLSIESSPTALAVGDGHIYVGVTRQETDTAALWVVDISNPGRPFEANLLRLDEPILSLAMTDSGYIVASGAGDQFSIFDARIPNEPVLMAGFSEPVATTPSLTTSGTTLFINDGSGVSLFDLTFPDNPERIERIEHPDRTDQPAGVDSEDLPAGESAFDVAAPQSAYLDLTVDNGLVALAAGQNGVVIVDIDDEPSRIRQHPARTGVRIVSVAVDRETLYTLSEIERTQIGDRFTLDAFDLTSTDVLVRAGDPFSLTGPAGFQRVITIDGNAWILSNRTIIRYQSSDD